MPFSSLKRKFFAAFQLGSPSSPSPSPKHEGSPSKKRRLEQGDSGDPNGDDSTIDGDANEDDEDAQEEEEVLRELTKKSKGKARESELEAELREVCERYTRLYQELKQKTDALKRINENAQCVICQEVIRNPQVMGECGHTYCYKCLRRWWTQPRRNHLLAPDERSISTDADSDSDDDDDDAPQAGPSAAVPTAGPSNAQSTPGPSTAAPVAGPSTAPAPAPATESDPQSAPPPPPRARHHFRPVIHYQKRCPECQTLIIRRPVPDFRLRNIIDASRLPPPPSSSSEPQDQPQSQHESTQSESQSESQPPPDKKSSSSSSSSTKHEDMWRGIFPPAGFEDDIDEWFDEPGDNLAILADLPAFVQGDFEVEDGEMEIVDPILEHWARAQARAREEEIARREAEEAAFDEHVRRLLGAFGREFGRRPEREREQGAPPPPDVVPPPLPPPPPPPASPPPAYTPPRLASPEFRLGSQSPPPVVAPPMPFIFVNPPPQPEAEPEAGAGAGAREGSSNAAQNQHTPPTAGPSQPLMSPIELGSQPQTPADNAAGPSTSTSNSTGNSNTGTQINPVSVFVLPQPQASSSSSSQPSQSQAQPAEQEQSPHTPDQTTTTTILQSIQNLRRQFNPFPSAPAASTSASTSASASALGSASAPAPALPRAPSPSHSHSTSSTHTRDAFTEVEVDVDGDGDVEMSNAEVEMEEEDEHTDFTLFHAMLHGESRNAGDQNQQNAHEAGEEQEQEQERYPVYFEELHLPELEPELQPHPESEPEPESHPILEAAPLVPLLRTRSPIRSPHTRRVTFNDNITIHGEEEQEQGLFLLRARRARGGSTPDENGEESEDEDPEERLARLVREGELASLEDENGNAGEGAGEVVMGVDLEA